MEKPLTRMMLGQAYWDYDITADTTVYPGRPSANGDTATVDIHTFGRAVTGTAGNMQSTGYGRHNIRIFL